MTDEHDLEGTASELVDTVRALNRSIERATDLRDELARLTHKSKVNRRLITIVVVGFILDVILTVSMAWVGSQAIHNSERLDHVVQVQHNSALCPLYLILLSSDTPANRDRAASQGQDIALRAQQFQIIRNSYAALKCDTK